MPGVFNRDRTEGPRLTNDLIIEFERLYTPGSERMRFTAAFKRHDVVLVIVFDQAIYFKPTVEYNGTGIPFGAGKNVGVFNG